MRVYHNPAIYALYTIIVVIARVFFCPGDASLTVTPRDILVYGRQRGANTRAGPVRGRAQQISRAASKAIRPRGHGLFDKRTASVRRR